MALVLIDTNLLIYLFDHNDPVKHAKSRSVLDKLQGIGAGRLSIQSLSEFASVAPKQLSHVVSISDVIDIVRKLASVFPICYVTPAIVANAARGVRDYQFSYYDAQIWSCALFNQIPLVFSEDFSDGQVIEDVRFVNPFAERFELEKWI
jgi:predicted nucleic acid-binding protein